MSQLANNGKVSMVIRAVHPLLLGLLVLFVGCDQKAETSPSLASAPSPMEDMRIPAAYHNTLPIDEFAAANGPMAADASAIAEPSILIVEHRIARRGDRSYLTMDLIVVNPLDKPMNYPGYRMDSFSDKVPPGQIHPQYHCQRTDPKSGKVDKTTPLFWCGTGSGMMSIPPKHAARFQVDVEMPVTSLRIGLTRFWSNPDGELQHEVMWTDEISPQE